MSGLDANGNNGAVANFDPTQDDALTLVHTGGGIIGYTPGEFAVNTASFDNSTQGGSFSVVPQGSDLALRRRRAFTARVSTRGRSRAPRNARSPAGHPRWGAA